MCGVGLGVRGVGRLMKFKKFKRVVNEPVCGRFIFSFVAFGDTLSLGVQRKCAKKCVLAGGFMLFSVFTG